MPTIFRIGQYRFYFNSREETRMHIHIDSTDGTNISRRGFWLLVNDKEFFISYSQYPEFLEMNLNQIFNVQSIDLIQFRWPDKDIDIDIESLETPESFPLHFKDNIN